MRGYGIRVMVIGSPTLSCIAKKLQDDTLMDLEFHPAIESDMGCNRHQNDKCNNNL